MLCPFRLVTGGWCPLCGLTRASVQLLRGDWARAVDYHPLVVPALVTLAVVWVVMVGRSAGWSRPRWVPSPAVLYRIGLIEAAVFVSVWAARLGTHDIPRPFA